MILNALAWFVAALWFIAATLFGPILLQFKVIYRNLREFRITKYKYYHFSGSITLTDHSTREDMMREFAIVEVPDKNMIVDYWRRFNNRSRFRYSLSFDDYLNFDFIKASTQFATIQDYKNRFINNLNYKTNYDIRRAQEP